MIEYRHYESGKTTVITTNARSVALRFATSREFRITSRVARPAISTPNGHTPWEMTNNHMGCRACANQLDDDSEFWEIYDQKSGETMPREQIVLEE